MRIRAAVFFRTSYYSLNRTEFVGGPIP
jgi:hypothetical protein